MKRLMSFARNLGSETREACQCFPLTMSAVFLVGIFICVIDRMEWFPTQILQKCEFFFFLFAVGSYLTETIFLEKEKRFWYAELIVAIVSLGGTVIFAIERHISAVQNQGIVWGGIGRYLTGYCLIVMILSVYIWYRRSQMGSEQYCIGVFQQFGKVTLTFILIAVGCVVLSRIFSALILNRKDFRIADILLGLTVTFFYIPALSMIWRERVEKIGVFVERMVKFVFLPVSVISGIIMYLYIIKLLIPFTIPSNQIFFMMTALFAGGMVTWTFIGNYEEDNCYMRLAEKLPYFYLPFFVVQAYALGVRLANYGITPNRYIGILILAFEFLYLCFYRIMKERIGNILPLYAVLIFLATWVPGVNVEAVSIRNQKAIAERYYTQDDTSELSEITWKRIYGAYLWLAEQPECVAYVNSMFSEEAAEEMKMQSGSSIDNRKGTYWLYDSNLVESLNTTGFTKVTPIHSIQYQNEQSQDLFEQVVKPVQKQVDLTGVMCQTDGQINAGEKGIVLNLQSLFDTYIKYYQDHQFQRTQEAHLYMREHNVYEISEKQTFVIDSIEVVLDQEKMQISRYSVKGYLLEK